MITKQAKTRRQTALKSILIMIETRRKAELNNNIRKTEVIKDLN